MKEIIKANGVTYGCTSVSTGVGSIILTMENQDAETLGQHFRSVSELTVTLEGEENPHGVYKNLKFKSITVYGDGSVSVKMHIKSETELRLDALEEGQELHAVAVQEIAGIVGG